MKMTNERKKDDDKPTLLKAVEIILADPVEIKREAESLYEKYYKRFKSDKSDDDIKDMVAEKIISNYSYVTAFIGGASALAGVIPGLGNVISTFRGATR